MPEAGVTAAPGSRPGRERSALRIVVDSTCDLPDQVDTSDPIRVIPAFLNIDGKSYLDGVDLSRADFYRDLPGYRAQPQTAAPSPARIRSVYQELAKQGATQILSIHVAGRLSATVDVVRSVAAELETPQVTVFDSEHLSLGAGFLAETAARLARAGEPVAAIVRVLRDQGNRTFTFAAFDTLEYLRRSGRVPGLVAGIGDLLRVKPFITLHRGELRLRWVRSWGRAEQELLAAVKSLGALERLGVVHADAGARAARVGEAVGAAFGFHDLPTVDVTPVIGAHAGPGAVGLVAVASETNRPGRSRPSIDKGASP